MYTFHKFHRTKEYEGATYNGDTTVRFHFLECIKINMELGTRFESVILSSEKCKHKLREYAKRRSLSLTTYVYQLNKFYIYILLKYNNFISCTFYLLFLYLK